MEYNDLENYFFENFLEMKKYIQPNVKTIGWLGKNSIFHQGSFLKRGEILNKLKILTTLKKQTTSLTMKNKKGNHLIIVMHTDFTRGEPYKCPFCNQQVYINDDVLGISRMIIPSVFGHFVYTFPSLLYHYIDAHNYIPPDEFLISLEKFSLKKSFSYNAPFNNKKIDSSIYRVETVQLA